MTTDNKALADLVAKWRAEADTCTNTCSNEDRGYNNAQYQLADELEAALTTSPVAALSPPQARPDGGIDGCTESNCPRCLTAPHARGDMQHAGIGSYPTPAPDVARLVEAARQELVRRSLTSLPLKLELGKKRGMTLDEVHTWMAKTYDDLPEALAPFIAPQQPEKGEG